MMNLSKEQREAGKAKFHEAIGMNRRDFLLSGVLAGAVSGAGLGAMYFGYEKTLSSPLRVGFIGTGDEGNVLINALTPSYVQVVAISDIRPFNIHRALHGDHSSESALKNRCGLIKKYGWSGEDEARRHVKIYDKDYRDLLADKNVEAIITALPLHMHARVVIDAMKANKHVLTEKLMGHSVHECKEMARMAKKLDRILAVGHQRHYSILYDNAVDTIRRGVIGDIHHIRAQWNRGNLPHHDSWQPPLPGDEKLAVTLSRLKTKLAAETDADKADALAAMVAQTEAQIADGQLDARSYGYEDIKLATGEDRSAMEELIRWRLWNRTGGGLMAELGSHQLDASGIFISGLRSDGEKALPLTVSAVGNRNLFPVDRDCEDHVYCIYEFPGPEYEKDPSKVIGVTYSSINGNGWGGYGETVLGTEGTLLLEREQEVLLFPTSNADSLVAANTKIGVSKSSSSAPTLDTTQSGGGEAAAVGKLGLSGPPSRGYTEEIEHWAWCIRNPDPKNLPRCNPKVALGDAVIALTTNIAMHEKRRIEFDKKWFDIDSDETPEGVKPDISQYS